MKCGEQGEEGALARAALLVVPFADNPGSAVLATGVPVCRPFAVVPCCVYASEFPRRRLAGQAVTQYHQLIDYLVSKAPDRIQVAELPFEGKNKVVYCM